VTGFGPILERVVPRRLAASENHHQGQFPYNFRQYPISSIHERWGHRPKEVEADDSIRSVHYKLLEITLLPLFHDQWRYIRAFYLSNPAFALL
jgi:hypothetical protein